MPKQVQEHGSHLFTYAARRMIVAPRPLLDPVLRNLLINPTHPTQEAKVFARPGSDLGFGVGASLPHLAPESSLER